MEEEGEERRCKMKSGLFAREAEAERGVGKERKSLARKAGS